MSGKVKEQLVRVGGHVSARNLARLRSALGYLEIGALVDQEMARPVPKMVDDRFAVFSEALGRISGEAPLYLEFGVFEGETLRWWAGHLPQPAARLVGFDSFEGLPESWRPGFDRGEFQTSAPQIDDVHVQLVAGWFDETLPSFVLPQHDQLIVNIDSDLYSSARTVLSWVAPHLQSGSLVYFDELADRDHELLALREFLAGSNVVLEPIAAGGGGAHFLFQVC